jgi:hypothetical protein
MLMEKGSGCKTVARGEHDGHYRGGGGGGTRRQPWLQGRRGQDGPGEPGRCAAGVEGVERPGRRGGGGGGGGPPRGGGGGGGGGGPRPGRLTAERQAWRCRAAAACDAAGASARCEMQGAGCVDMRRRGKK